MSNKYGMITCEGCKRRRVHFAKGLCMSCYNIRVAKLRKKNKQRAVGISPLKFGGNMSKKPVKGRYIGEELIK